MTARELAFGHGVCRVGGITCPGLSGTALRLVAALLIGCCSLGAQADQSDSRLESLFAQLQQAPDMYAAATVEGQIWRIWLESSSTEINRLMSEGVEAMNTGRLEAAIAWFDQIVDQAPDFAEGWNKRATAYYLNNQLEASMADIRQTLTLEPRHFGAISGLGLIFLRLGDEASALRAFREVLKIHPQSPSANINARELAAKLGEKGA